MQTVAILGPSKSYLRTISKSIEDCGISVIHDLFDRSDYDAMEDRNLHNTLIYVGESVYSFLDRVIGDGQIAFSVSYEEISDSFVDVLSYMREKCKIVHIKDGRLFRPVVSELLESSIPPLFCDPDSVEEMIRAQSDRRREIEIVVRNGMVFDFHYEEFLEDSEPIMEKLASFLGVREIKSPDPILEPDFREVVENLDDLRNRFDGTLLKRELG